MIDNLIGSLDFTAKLPLDIKTNQELPKFREITPVNIKTDIKIITVFLGIIISCCIFQK
jgi:hypothetical protein